MGQDLAPPSRDGCRQVCEAGGGCSGPDGSIKAQGKSWAFCENHVCPCHSCSFLAGDTGPQGCGTCHLPASLPSPAPLGSPMLCRGQPGMWEARRAGMKFVASQNQGGKCDGGSLVWGTVGTPLGAPLPRKKHPESSRSSAAYIVPQHVLLAGGWGSIHPSSSLSSLPSSPLSFCPSILPAIPLSLHPSCRPSISTP